MTRLQSAPVTATTQPGLKVPCFECSAMVPYADAVIDLDGPAFKAYYHPDHAPKVLCAIDGRTDHNTDAHDTLWGYTSLHIEGRRWFQRGPGNTYHSVRIFKNGERIAYLPFEYGYGDGFLQTALDWLKANGHAPADAEYGTLYLRETLHSTYSVADVARKSDL